MAMKEQQLRTPGFIAVTALAMLLQVGLLFDGWRSGQDVMTLLSALGLALMVFTTVLVVRQRARVHEVVSVTLWLAGAWFVLLWVSVVQRGSSPIGMYMAQLIWVALTCLFLPVRLAMGLAVTSGAAVTFAVLSAARPDWPLFLAVHFTAGLIGFVSVHGNSLREEIVGQGRSQQTGLLIGRAALFALEDTYRRQLRQVAGLGILAVSAEWFGEPGDPAGRGQRELAGVIRENLEAGDFVCMRDERTFLVVLAGGLPMDVVGRAERLVRRVNRAGVSLAPALGPVLVRSGLALSHERGAVISLVTLARQRAFQALQTGHSELLWEEQGGGSEGQAV